jgi:hypothetical protein
MTPTSSGQLLRLPPPPSSGRRRKSPRGVEHSSLSGSPGRRRQAGDGPDPGHRRPKPSMIRVPRRLRRTGCSLGLDRRPAEPAASRAPDSPTETVGDSGPAPPPASRLGLGPRPDADRVGSRAEVGVRASRWYEHQEALERGGWVTPPSTLQTLRPRRPRHRADAASCLAVWILVPLRPRPPTSELASDRSCGGRLVV